jgi:hypothetical protein
LIEKLDGAENGDYVIVEAYKTKSWKYGKRVEEIAGQTQNLQLASDRASLRPQEDHRGVERLTSTDDG